MVFVIQLISFQIKSFLCHQVSNKKIDFIYLLIGNNIPLHIFPEMLDFDRFVDLNYMAVNIYALHFIDNEIWFDKTIPSVIPISIYYLINNQIGEWYDYIKRKDFWRYREFWTCKMWVV
jgi:hypothetical protein